MARVSVKQHTFNSGEISPLARGRDDVDWFKHACRRLLNMICTPWGPATRRGGTRYIVPVADHNGLSVLRPFKFSTLQVYMLEIAAGVMRFCRDKGQLVAPDTDAVVTNGDFAANFIEPFAHVWQVDDTPADTAFVDETADANSATDNDWELFPAVEAVGDYAAFGFTAAFEQIRFDYANGVVGVAGVVAWEYWDGAAWTALSDVTDETAGFTAAAADNLIVSWTVPLDWAARTISTSASLFWVRARVTTVYTTNPVLDQGVIPTVWLDRSTGAASIGWNAGAALELIGAAGETAWAEQAVAVGVGFQGNVHHLKFRIDAQPGDPIQLRVGTTSAGNELVDDVELTSGWHVHGFTPGAATVYIQFRNAVARTVKIDDVALIDNAPLEIGAPWAESVLLEIGRTQSADVLYAVHESTWPHKLLRRSDTDWSLVSIDAIDGPYEPENATATTLQPSAATGFAITITASATLGINGGKGFLATDVGRLVGIKNGANWGYARITGHTDALNVTAEVKADFSDASANAAWRLGSWSDSTGYPASVVFHQERLTFGQVNKRHLSRVADFETFRPGSLADDAMTLSIASNEVNASRWLASSTVLLDGTTGGEIAIGNIDANDVIAPENPPKVRPNTYHGSASVAPAFVGSVVLFLQRALRKLRVMVFDLTQSGFKAPDLTLRAEHITEGGIVDMAYAQELFSVLWCVRADGALLGFTYDRDESVLAWHRHRLGGAGAVESVAVIPGDRQDQVWLTVRRRLGGVTKRFIEILEPPLIDEATLQEDAFYVDAGLSLDNPVAITNVTRTNPVKVTAPAHGFANGDPVRIQRVLGRALDEDGVVRIGGIAGLNGKSFVVANAGANDFDLQDAEGANVDGTGFPEYWEGGEVREKVTVVSGLDHLEGETVDIMVDGAAHPLQVVAGGQVTLVSPASKVHVGLPYDWILEPERLSEGSEDGSAQGKLKRIDRVNLQLFRSLGVKIGRDDKLLEEIPFRRVEHAMDTAVPLFSGNRMVDFNGDVERDGRLILSGSGVFPATIVSIAPRLAVHDG